MNKTRHAAQTRFLATLEIVRRELAHLKHSHARLNAAAIDPHWVESLDKNPEAADMLEAFISRYGRIQDTMGGKLLPRALSAMAEKPGAMLDNLARAEQLGWIDDEEVWLGARELRNRLIHEYMTDPDQFARDIQSALTCIVMFKTTYQNLLAHAERQFGIVEDELVKYWHGDNASA